MVLVAVLGPSKSGSAVIPSNPVGMKDGQLPISWKYFHSCLDATKGDYKSQRFSIKKWSANLLILRSSLVKGVHCELNLI